MNEDIFITQEKGTVETCIALHCIALYNFGERKGLLHPFIHS
jgi:hypothetical protein